jgi:hypothetical protein
MLHISLDTGVSKLTANEALGIKDSVLQRFKEISKNDVLETRFDSLSTNSYTAWRSKATYMSIHSCLIFGVITKKTFRRGKGNAGRGRTVALVVGNYFHAAIVPDTDTTVGRPEIDTDTCSGF